MRTKQRPGFKAKTNYNAGGRRRATRPTKTRVFSSLQRGDCFKFLNGQLKYIVQTIHRDRYNCLCITPGRNFHKGYDIPPEYWVAKVILC